MSIDKFFRTALKQLPSPYAPAERLERVAEQLGLPVEQIIKLDSGENSFGPKLEVDWQKLAQQIPFYPDSQATSLRQALAKDLGVPMEMVAVGNGSDELIDLICRLFLEKGKTLVDFPPTFPMFSFFAKLNGAKVVNVPRLADFSLDIEKSKVALQKSNLVFLANPNNPTGTLIELETIVELLKVGCPLVVDEAYFEFSGLTALPLLKQFENLIILRTFSKWAGLAGLRVGFVVAQPKIIGQILTIKAPYNVNFFAQELAQVVLIKKAEFMKSIAEINEGRDWFIKEASKIKDLRVVPSRASCITLIPLKRDAKEVAFALKQKGIFVKVLNLPGLENALRVSAGPKEVMEKTINCLGRSLKNN